MSTDNQYFPFSREPDHFDANGLSYLVNLHNVTEAMEHMYAYWMARKKGNAFDSPVAKAIINRMMHVLSEGLDDAPPDPLPQDEIYKKVRVDHIKQIIEEAKRDTEGNRKS